MPKAFIGLGSNMGRKEENIKKALIMLTETGGMELLQVAPLYRTNPVGFLDQDRFVNTVAVFETAIPPLGLLNLLLRVESEMGRRRIVHWGPRVIDLDLLMYDGLVVNTPELQLPHPRMEERAFVMAPLADLCPDMVMPGGKRAAELAKELSLSQKVVKL